MFGRLEGVKDVLASVVRRCSALRAGKIASGRGNDSMVLEEPRNLHDART